MPVSLLKIKVTTQHQRDLKDNPEEKNTGKGVQDSIDCEFWVCFMNLHSISLGYS